MIVKVHSTPNGKLFAICDSDILGRVFEEKGRQLDLSSRFYQGEEMPEHELGKLLKDCYVINAVGKKSVAFLVRLKLIDDKNVMTIDNIPYAQCAISPL
ncbi:MAG: DUF424 family protein [Nanoarchaeota archaeon]|nr:DUF424 family protein [Nanoarchaeota archaeon]